MKIYRKKARTEKERSRIGDPNTEYGKRGDIANNEFFDTLKLLQTDMILLRNITTI